MGNAGGREQEIATVKCFAPIVDYKLSAAAYHDVSLVPGVRILWILFFRRVNLHGQCPMLEQFCESLALRTGHAVQRFLKTDSHFTDSTIFVTVDQFRVVADTPSSCSIKLFGKPKN